MLLAAVLGLCACTPEDPEPALSASAEDRRGLEVTAHTRIPIGPATPPLAGVIGMIRAADGGFWLAGIEEGLFGRAVLKKVGGSTPSACGPDGSRMLTELSDRYDRRPTITSMASSGDGAIYLAGKGLGGQFLTRYLESTCRSDPDFGSSGYVDLPPVGLLQHGNVYVAMDPAGRLVVAAAFVDRVYVRRLLPSGQWDDTFGQLGVTLNPAPPPFMANSLAVSPVGGIYLGGGVEIPFGTEPAILKLNPDGRVDTAFGIQGVMRYPEVSRGTGGVGPVIAESGQLVFAGGTADSVALDDITTNDSYIAAADLTTGRLLANFGEGGYYRWDWGYENSNMLGALTQNARGGYSTCGHVIKGFLIGQWMALADFTADGLPDRRVGYEGRRLVANTPMGGCVALLSQPGGGLTVGGNDAGGGGVMFIQD